MPGGISARVVPTPETKLKAARLRTVSPMVPFRKRMTVATSPLVQAVRNAARSTPSTHSRYKAQERGGSLRSAVANSIQRKVRLSNRNVLVVIKQVPKGGKSNLARVLEGEIPWDHPTYGHKPEVTQEPHPYFFDTIEKRVPAIDRELDKILRDIDRMLL